MVTEQLNIYHIPFGIKNLNTTNWNNLTMATNLYIIRNGAGISNIPSTKKRKQKKITS
jgi:hypothetical protein